MKGICCTAEDVGAGGCLLRLAAVLIGGSLVVDTGAEV